jgi:tetratricopeptide (TPR) repeat protein
MVEAICSESLAAIRESPARALELTELALQIAEAVPGSEGWRSRVQAFAWAHFGNARRVQGQDLRSAEEAFSRFGRLWKAGATSDPGLLSEALVLGLEASFRRANRQLLDSLSLLRKALDLDPDGSLRASLLINLSKTFEQLGFYHDAITKLQEAATLVNSDAEPELCVALYQNLATNLCHLERHREAEPMLPEVRGLVTRLGAEIHQVRVRWLEGKVAAGLGRLAEAEAALGSVRTEFAAREMAYDAALVTMELAALYAAQGRTGEVQLLARQSAVVFSDQGVHAEACRALDLFRQAAEEEVLTAELAQRLVRYLYRAQHDPDLRFDPAA